MPGFLKVVALRQAQRDIFLFWELDFFVQHDFNILIANNCVGLTF